MSISQRPQERTLSWRESLADVLDQVAVDRDPFMEDMLLGALILQPAKIDVVSSRLKGTDFYDRDLGEVYTALCVLRDMKQPVGDIKLLAAKLKKFGLIGKSEYSLQMADIAKWCARAQPSSALAYAEEIIRHSQIRLQLTAVIESINALVDGNEDPQKSARELLATIESIYARTNIEVHSIGDAAERAVAKVAEATKQQKLIGVSTSLHSLDDMLGGLFPGELTIIAARPSIGKTALAMQICHAAAGSGKRVLFVSLEMRDEELAMRVCCAASGVNGKHVRQVTVSEEEIARLYAAASELRGYSLDIYAPPKAGLRQIKAAIKNASFQSPVELVCIDYLGLIEPADKKKFRAEQVAEISGGLKELAKEFNVPVLALSQLNREAEGEVPTMAHLRESGAIEQDADVIIAIHRGEAEEGKPIAQLIILKNRHGERGTIECTWRPEATRFEEPLDTGELPLE